MVSVDCVPQSTTVGQMYGQLVSVLGPCNGSSSFYWFHCHSSRCQGRCTVIEAFGCVVDCFSQSSIARSMLWSVNSDDPAP